jgi:hypothetical protein
MQNILLNSALEQMGEVMRKWYLPMTVVGLGGLGVLLFTERGRRAIEWMGDRVEEAPDALADWNEAALREIDRIQAAVNRVAKSLESMEPAQ